MKINIWICEKRMGGRSYNVFKKKQCLLHNASDPDSPSYGDYLTTDQITKLVAPTNAIVATVLAWIKSYGTVNC